MGRHVYVANAYVVVSNTTLLFPILPCEIILRVPVKTNGT